MRSIGRPWRPIFHAAANTQEDEVVIVGEQLSKILLLLQSGYRSHSRSTSMRGPSSTFRRLGNDFLLLTVIVP